MNSKESQNELEQRLAHGLFLKLQNLGADAAKAKAAIAPMDFDTLRHHYSRTDEDLKAQFAACFK